MAPWWSASWPWARSSTAWPCSCSVRSTRRRSRWPGGRWDDERDRSQGDGPDRAARGRRPARGRGRGGGRLPVPVHRVPEVHPWRPAAGPRPLRGGGAGGGADGGGGLRPGGDVPPAPRSALHRRAVRAGRGDGGGLPRGPGRDRPGSDRHLHLLPADLRLLGGGGDAPDRLRALPDPPLRGGEEGSGGGGRAGAAGGLGTAANLLV